MIKKFLVIVTAACFVCCLGLMFYKKQKLLPQKARVSANVRHFPTIGNIHAPINITVFEEPACSACAEFTSSVYPLLKKHYIDTGDVSFTLIPVSFIKGSRPAVRSVLCVYNHDPKHPDSEACIEYFDRLVMYPKEGGKPWATAEILMKLAEGLTIKSGKSLNMQGLQQCFESSRYDEQIEKNNIYGSQVLDGHLVTPTVIVGNYLIEDPTFDEIERVIKQIRYLQDSEGHHD